MYMHKFFRCLVFTCTIHSISATCFLHVIALLVQKLFHCQVKCDVSYVVADTYLYHFSNDGQEFCGAIYQKVNDDLETAVNLSWTAGSNATRFSLAGKYTFDKDASMSVRIPNSRFLGYVFLGLHSLISVA